MSRDVVVNFFEADGLAGKDLDDFFLTGVFPRTNP